MSRHGKFVRRRGFTLAELLTVIGIISVLMGLMLPAIQRVREVAQQLSCRNNLHQIGLALHHFHANYNRFPPAFLYDDGTAPWRFADAGDRARTKSAWEGVWDRALPGAARTVEAGNRGLSGGMADWLKIHDRPVGGVMPPMIPAAPGWGWAAILLPYIEQDAVESHIDYHVSLDSEVNQDLRTMLMRSYTCPSDRSTGVFTVLSQWNSPRGDAATNSYAACYGAGGKIGERPELGNGIFYRNSRIAIGDVHDGVSHTIAVGERAAIMCKAPWAGVFQNGTIRTTWDAPIYLAAIEEAPVMAMARVGNHTLNHIYSEPYDFFTPHPAAGMFLFADGSVRAISKSTSVEVLQSLATRSGGEVVDDDGDDD